MPKKTIVRNVRFVNTIDVSEPDRDRIEPICYLNIFQDSETKELYGWRTYDDRLGRPQKNDWCEQRKRYKISFVPKNFCETQHKTHIVWAVKQL